MCDPPDRPTPDGPLRIVLLPGLDGTGLLFRPFLGQCPGFLEPIVVSYPPDQALGYDELLPRIRPCLPTNGSFLLLGESFSGPLAIRAAAQAPPGLIGVILAASFATPPKPTFIARLPIGLPVRLAWRSMKIRRLMRRRRLGEQGLLAAARAVEKVDPRVVAFRIRETLRVNAAEALRACPAPILYLQARKDRVVGAHAWERIRAVRPDAVHALIDSPHMLLQYAPSEAWDAILPFLDDLGYRV